MSKILKHFMKPDPNAYVFRPSEELVVEEKKKAPEAPPPPEEEAAEVREPEPEDVAEEAPEPERPKTPIDYAEIQAAAILVDARREAEEYQERARQEFEKELEELRRSAREEGFNTGYTEGIATALRDGQAQLEKMASDQIKAVESFLEAAAIARDKVLEQSKEELKMLALAIAEKVIRISLKGSDDILRRMVEAATDKHRRCEWAHIYVADCDVKGSANTIPELTAALRGVSARVRVIPMAGDESGTCIIEMPDEILDASVSTQLSNIREVLQNSSLDEERS